MSKGIISVITITILFFILAYFFLYNPYQNYISLNIEKKIIKKEEIKKEEIKKEEIDKRYNRKCKIFVKRC